MESGLELCAGRGVGAGPYRPEGEERSISVGWAGCWAASGPWELPSSAPKAQEEGDFGVEGRLPASFCFAPGCEAG